MPPVQPHSAPLPTAQQIDALRALQIRVLPIAADTIFPKVLDILLDNGYTIRSVNTKTGFVYFSQQWTDDSQSDANITLEGCLVFTPQGPGSSQVRLSL